MVFLVYFLFAIIIFIYNYNCYKNNKIVFTMKKKFIQSLNNKYYNLQFKLWNGIAIFFILIGFANYFNKNRIMIPIYLLVTIIFFWGINFLLESISSKKNI